MTRRESKILLAAAAWTLYVWISRVIILSGGDESFGFKAVHTVLALVSITFAVLIARIGWRHMRSSVGTGPTKERI